MNIQSNLCADISSSIKSSEDLLARRRAHYTWVNNNQALDFECASATYVSLYQYGNDEPVVMIHCLVPAFVADEFPELLNLIEHLATLAGDDAEITSIDVPNENFREYIIGNKFRVIATLKDDGSCTRAIVGMRKTQEYKLVETEAPVYEFKC
jgi:hypothetical protein